MVPYCIIYPQTLFKLSIKAATLLLGTRPKPETSFWTPFRPNSCPQPPASLARWLIGSAVPQAPRAQQHMGNRSGARGKQTLGSREVPQERKEREADRQTESQTGRWTGQRDRQTADRQPDRQTDCASSRREARDRETCHASQPLLPELPLIDRRTDKGRGRDRVRERGCIQCPNSHMTLRPDRKSPRAPMPLIPLSLKPKPHPPTPQKPCQANLL